MKARVFLVALLVGIAGLVSVPTGAANAVGDTPSAQLTRHPCTRTSSGSCIQGGQFCPQASYGHSGWDAQGRRYVCKGDRTHPHWMRP